jgi:hypothetical protein
MSGEEEEEFTGRDCSLNLFRRVTFMTQSSEEQADIGPKETKTGKDNCVALEMFANMEPNL